VLTMVENDRVGGGGERVNARVRGKVKGNWISYTRLAAQRDTLERLLGYTNLVRVMRSVLGSSSSAI
jgi:hypothetical protein